MNQDGVEVMAWLHQAATDGLIQVNTIRHRQTGGQRVGLEPTPDVQVVHVPTGVSVTVPGEFSRSQIRGLEKAAEAMYILVHLAAL